MITILLFTADLLTTILLLLSAFSPHLSPSTFHYLSLAGLAFPLFVVMEIAVALALLLFRRYKLLALSVLALALCGSQIRTSFPWNTRTEPLPEDAFKVLSYNTMMLGQGNGDDGLRSVLGYLAGSGSDIICLQEFPQANSSAGRSADKALKDYPYKKKVSVGNHPSRNLVVCYSKYPILNGKMIEMDGDSNGAAAFRIKKGNDTLLVVNCHLESNRLTGDDKKRYEAMIDNPKRGVVRRNAPTLLRKLSAANVQRAKQADAVAKFIDYSKMKNIIVCGDFNDSPISYTHHRISENLNDTYTESGKGFGFSYNRNKLFFRIDNILTSKNIKSYNCRVDKTIKASDHYPIWCYVSLH